MAYRDQRTRYYGKGGSTKDGQGIGSSSDVGSSSGVGSSGGDWGMVGALGNAIAGLMDGTTTFSGKTSPNQKGQKGTTADRSGGPGDDRERTLPPPPAKIPGVPSEVDPKIFQALRTAADTDDYFSNLQAIALGGLGSQQALANFSVAPEQNYFEYRASTPEFGPLGSTDSLEDGGPSIAEIFRKLSQMSLNAPVTQYAEGGRVGENLDSRGNPRERPRPTSGETTDVSDFGKLIQALMLMTPETRDVESPFGGPDKPRVRRPESEVTPGGLMPRNVPPRPPASQTQVRMPVDNEPMNIIPEAFHDGILVESLAPPPSLPPLPGEKPEAPIRPRPELIEDRLGNELSSARENPSTVKRTEGPSTYEQALELFIDRQNATGGGPPPNAYPSTEGQRFEDLEAWRDEQFPTQRDQSTKEDIINQMAAKLGSQPTRPGETTKDERVDQIKGEESGTLPSAEENALMDTKILKEYGQSDDKPRSVAYAYFRSLGLFPQDAKRMVDNLSDTELNNPARYREVESGPQDQSLGETDKFMTDMEKLVSLLDNRVLSPDELGQMGSMGFAGGGDTGRGQFRNPRGKGQSQIQRPINSPLAPVADPAPTGLPSVLPPGNPLINRLPEEFRDGVEIDKYMPTGTSPRPEDVRPPVGPTPRRVVGHSKGGERPVVGRGRGEDRWYKNGGSVRGDALPMVEGDHVVPAHAVRGNEGGLAALVRRLTGNQNYDGMIRGPGGPREDAIKTRVYAAGGGISGKMDNLQNPFNSVPARVSDKEYVIPRQAITNLGMMHGAREGDANKAGQDIIYQMVENLKRKA